MPPDPRRSWDVQDFEPRLDEWAAVENPPADLLTLIIIWGLSLLEDPYRDARRAEGFEDLWFAIIPGTWNGTHAVTLSFFVDAKDQIVRCSLFGYQCPPFGR